MEEKEAKKTDSRKFVVWLVWLIITILVIAWCGLVMIITKQIQDQRERSDRKNNMDHRTGCLCILLHCIYPGEDAAGKKQGDQDPHKKSGALIRNSL